MAKADLFILAQANRPKVLLTCDIELRLVLLVRHDSKSGRVTVLSADCG